MSKDFSECAEIYWSSFDILHFPLEDVDIEIWVLKAIVRKLSLGSLDKDETHSILKYNVPCLWGGESLAFYKASALHKPYKRLMKNHPMTKVHYISECSVANCLSYIPIKHKNTVIIFQIKY